MGGKKIKVEMISQRKIIDVVRGYFRGSPDRIEVDVCVTCGAVVFDPIGHHTWHQSIAEGAAK